MYLCLFISHILYLQKYFLLWKCSGRIKLMPTFQFISSAMGHIDFKDFCGAYILPEYIGTLLTIPSMWSADQREPPYRIMKETVGKFINLTFFSLF